MNLGLIITTLTTAFFIYQNFIGDLTDNCYLLTMLTLLSINGCCQLKLKYDHSHGKIRHFKRDTVIFNGLQLINLLILTYDTTKRCIILNALSNVSYPYSVGSCSGLLLCIFFLLTLPAPALIYTFDKLKHFLTHPHHLNGMIQF